MSKRYLCASCGSDLKVFLKAIPKKGEVLRLVESHKCDPERIVDNYEFLPGTTFDNKTKETSDSKLDFSFVDKLNKASDTDPLITGDKRSKDHHRKEIQTSSAPAGIRAMTGLNHSPVSTDKDLKGPEDG